MKLTNYKIYFTLFVVTVYKNLHAKSGVSSLKNGWVIALGTKEDTSYIYILYISISWVDNTVQTLEFVVRKFGQFALLCGSIVYCYHTKFANKQSALLTVGCAVWH